MGHHPSSMIALMHLIRRTIATIARPAASLIEMPRATRSTARKVAVLEDRTEVKSVVATIKPEPELEAENEAPIPKKAKKVVKKVTTKVKAEVRVEEKVVAPETKPKAKTKRKSIKNEEAADADEAGEGDEDAKPAPKKRKTKAEKEAEENMIFAPRTAISSLKRSMFIGAHVSGAGGIQNSVQNAVKIGANAFALFLKSQRKWESPPLADENRDAWHVQIKELGYDAAKHVLPHGSYLVNLAQVEKDKADQAYGNFIDDLKRCDALGIELYNFHPGSTGGDTKEAAIGRIAAQLNRAHKETEKVVTVLECMCGSGNVIGSTFEELRDIIALVEDKSRVGVCIDTCHAFAAGYDLRTPEAFQATMKKFDEVVGMGYLKAIHLNDSKAPFASHRDLHANIGTGFLGLRAFHNVMNFAPFENIPVVLETPIEVKGPDGKMVEDKKIWADEIKLLESLIEADTESAEFLQKDKELQEKGASERKRIQEQVDKKAEKDAEKAKKEALKEAKKGTKEKGSLEKFLIKKKPKKKKEMENDSGCDSCGESDGE